MLIAKSLTLEAGTRTLLADADLALHDGDKVGLVGRNGAGKTTLLRVLADRAAPKSGSVARSGVVGYLSQETALRELSDREVTALERVLMAREIGNLERRMEKVRQQIDIPDSGL